MKTQLTKEQSNRLCCLGCKFPYNIAIQDESGDFYIRITFTDLLEILPKEINNRNDLNMEWHSLMERYVVGYGSIETSRRFAEELIDALYELTIWCIKEGYLKFE